MPRCHPAGLAGALPIMAVTRLPQLHVESSFDGWLHRPNPNHAARNHVTGRVSQVLLTHTISRLAAEALASRWAPWARVRCVP